MSERFDSEVWTGVSRRLAAVEALIPEPPPRRLVDHLVVDVPVRIGWGRAFGEPAGRRRPIGRLAWGLVAVVSILAITAGAILVAGALFGPHPPGPFGRNGEIVFAGGDFDQSGPRIDVIGADGRDQRTLVSSDSDRLDCPTFSPDGVRIAFLTAGGALSTMSVDGSGSRHLDAVVVRQGRPGHRPFDWSPDSSAIAFVPDTAATDGTGPFNKVDILSVGSGATTRVHVREIELVLELAWSPDGRRIALLGGGGNTVDDRYLSRLYTVRPDGTDLRLLSTFRGGVDYARGGLTWSPDSKRIAYARNVAPGDQTADIYVISADGRGETDLTRTSAADDTSPAWSPDGRSIAFVSWIPRGAVSSVVVMGTDGSDQRIVDGGPAILGIAWSPDATRLLVAPDFNTTTAGTFLPRSVAADGLGPSIELPSLFGQCVPSWQRLDP